MYNQETRKLEFIREKFVGKCRTGRHFNLEFVKDLECDDDDDDDDDDDGQVRDVVVADHILQGLCST